MDKHIGTIQAAEILGVTQRRVRAMCKAGRLRAKKLGRDWFIKHDDLQALGERHAGRPRYYLKRYGA